MPFEDLLNDRRAGILALRVSRLLPVKVGLRVADNLAGKLSTNPKLPMVQAIRQNQWVVNGENLPGDQLDQVVDAVLHHITRNFYFLFHYHGRSKAMQKLMNFPASIEELIQRSKDGKFGAVVTGVHMSNFDLIMQATVLHGLKALALSLPDGNEAVEWQHRLRRSSGVEVVSASFSTSRQAIRRLMSGGVVMTGMDYPVHGLSECPYFFGRPAQLPTHYIHLALAAKVPLIIVGAIINQEGLYQIITSDWIYLKSFSDRRKEILYNAEKALEVAADFIRKAPPQWVISKPVWSGIDHLLPSSNR